MPASHRWTAPTRVSGPMSGRYNGKNPNPKSQIPNPKGLGSRFGVWGLGFGLWDLLGLYMNPALELLALPAAGPRVRRVERKRRARLAADTREAEVVERKQRNPVVFRVRPDVLRRPRRQRGDPLDHLAARQPEPLDFLEVGARRRLVAAQRGKPGVIALERGEERAHFVAGAARLGAGGFPQANSRFRGAQDDQVQPPGFRHLVAILERFVEMMEGLEEQHRNVRLLHPEYVGEHHAFGLEAGCDARPGRAGECGRDVV